MSILQRNSQSATWINNYGMKPRNAGCFQTGLNPPILGLPLFLYTNGQQESTPMMCGKGNTRETMAHLQARFDQVAPKVDHLLLNRMIRLGIDHNLADYVTAKNNVNISFKVMPHRNFYGLTRGLQFSPFVMQYYGLMVDLLVPGLRRATELAGSPTIPNEWLTFENIGTEIAHPIRM
ncbi:Pre-mRNA-processing-splicing factor 8 [Gracilariopsis chorda]|uniref:Pre-mRNA-processing-splicing factor 8 n=1 Tax=Gracilariopsis chorda TaxID=448386 RepID=A0A2V3IEL0_9FLOR|nr:Pre-mRNA-processing-splicing factor 8 [Gracilariopsis chorda]|eukprot:PXF40526.1 Pre-mRNA-processing-splicing factor 8 [Gracilariopsis chorda]